MDPDLELTPPTEIDLTLVIICWLKTLDGSSCKNVYLVPQLHMSGIHMKKFKKLELTAENGIDQ